MPERSDAVILVALTVSVAAIDQLTNFSLSQGSGPTARTPQSRLSMAGLRWNTRKIAAPRLVCSPDSRHF